MAISIRAIRSSAPVAPPLIMIHSVKGVGKTSLAAEFPNPIYVSTEGEATPRGIDIPSTEKVSEYEDLRNVIQELASEEHEFQTLIVDAVDKVEPMVFRETCARHKWTDIESPGFGKGYVAADDVWRELLEGFAYLRTERNMTVILICHSEAVSHEEPGVQPYKRYDPRLQKRGSAVLCDGCDFILHVNNKVEMKEVEVGFNKKHTHAEGGGTRWIYTDARPAFVAKNRGKGMPAQIVYKAGEGFSKLAPYLFPPVEEKPAASLPKGKAPPHAKIAPPEVEAQEQDTAKAA